MGALLSSLASALTLPTPHAEDLLIRLDAQLEPKRRTCYLLLAVGAVLLLYWYLRRRRSRRVFYVQVQTSGKTGGCERQFLNDVSKLLSQQGVSLSVKDFRDTLMHLCVLFCPIASRMGTDLENALEGLRGEQKAVLVVMHYVTMENTDAYVDTRQVPHPALVRTVHTRYTLPDGIYPCELNVAAEHAVAAAIKDFAERH